MAISSFSQIGISSVRYTADGKSIILPLDGYIYYGDDVTNGSVRAGIISGVFTVQTLTGGVWVTDFEAI